MLFSSCYRVLRAIATRAGRRAQEERQKRLEGLGVLIRRPKRPDQAAAATRAKTFRRSWPHRLALSPENMAEAGFYYTGPRDLVRCFYCNCGLKNWEAADNPWEEHCRYHPQCPYVRCVNAYLPADRQTISEEDLRKLLATVERPGQPARAREDMDAQANITGRRTRCWNCNRNEPEVVFPCGHKNVCWDCYKCLLFLDTLHPLPKCHDCQRPFHEVFQDRIIQINCWRSYQTRRIRPGQNRGRCCRNK